MPKATFTANDETSLGMNAKSDSGYRLMAYDGDLGGGTLEIFTEIEGIKTPVPNAKLDETMLDDNSQAIQQVAFSSAGNIWVHLTGATDPDVTVVVL